MATMATNGVEKPGKPFALIFMIEHWERFGYYGMQALMVIFMVNALGFGDAKATITYSAFTAMTYAFISVGGYIGDKVLGTKRTMLAGAITLGLGYALLGYDPHNTVFYGLGLIVAGNMLFKANPSSIVSKLYKENDPRLDSAFTMYYMSINIGSFISMVLCPIIQSHYGYGAAFTACAVGLGFAVILYIIFSKALGEVGSEPDFNKVNVLKLAGIIVLLAVMTLACGWLLSHVEIVNILLVLALIATFGIMIKLIISADSKKERYNYIVCFILIIEAIAFFILYQQMPTSLNLFAIRNTDHMLLGQVIPGETFQSLNPFWVMAASPVAAIVYSYLGRKNKDLSMPGKFALGMFLCALAFLTIPFAVKFVSNADGLVSGNWLIVVYGFQSVGEILISGLGLSMVAKLVPQRVMGFMMGAWFMSTAVAMLLGGFVASLASVPQGITDPTQTIHIYSNLFLKLGIAAFIACVIMTLAVPKLKQFMK